MVWLYLVDKLKPTSRGTMYRLCLLTEAHIHRWSAVLAQVMVKHQEHSDILQTAHDIILQNDFSDTINNIVKKNDQMHLSSRDFILHLSVRTITVLDIKNYKQSGWIYIIKKLILYSSVSI